ncbi:glycosyltransferase [Paraurantiacibacter namhicola]|uniref:D-inositol 3-phosphate glycosyltransferase n=1 Tax=Paraurantiacibacter namhicola TaxID=645517 RepID=A0A1C7D6C6_9SPHN|nr:glycosyltransferase [Paraurantiacibacter namhicola]ANU06912.1 D-inositol 3-phosphate glycosyltransferase [Paraurantiacibacter namhicola]
MTGWPRSVLIFCPEAHGGLAEHVHYQARELAGRAIDVTLLCRPDFVKPAAGEPYRQDRSLAAGPEGPGIMARLGRAAADVRNRLALAVRIGRTRPDFVLLSANAEYRAALWSAPHIALHRAGQIYLANFHDHRYPAELPAGRMANLRLGYAMIDGGLEYASRDGEPYLPERMIVRSAPFGSFDDLGDCDAGGAREFRASIGAADAETLALAFGHIRDSKRLDVAVQALAHMPGAHLLIAGGLANASQRPASHYRDIAQALGVAERLHIIDRFIEEAEIAKMFRAADICLLPYGADFRSASGVLHIAAHYGLPVVASGGEGPLVEAIGTFGIGSIVPPGDPAALAEAIQHTAQRSRAEFAPSFARFRETLSWQRNIDLLLEVAREVKARRGI